MPYDTNSVQNTAHCLTTQTLSRTQPTASRHKLCPQHSPLPHDTNSVQNTAHCLTTQTLSRTQSTASRHKLCPEHSLVPCDTNCAHNKAHSHLRLLTSSLPNTYILIFCGPLVIFTTCRNLRKLRFATQIIYAFSIIHAINITFLNNCNVFVLSIEAQCFLSGR